MDVKNICTNLVETPILFLRNNFPNRKDFLNSDTYVNTCSLAKKIFDTVVVTPVVRVSNIIYTNLLKKRSWLESSNPLLLRIYVISLKVFGYRKKQTLYCYQDALPTLPVPPLKQTMQKYLESIKPLLTAEQYKKSKKNVEKFLNGAGPELQNTLYLLGYVKRNWLKDWWDAFAYLRNREPLPLTTNWSGSDRNWDASPNLQIERSARIARFIGQFHQMIKDETLPPIKLYGHLPLCMDQYSRLFSTCRIPGLQQDCNKTYTNSKHIVVFCKNRPYAFDIYNDNNELLTIKEVEKHIRRIREDADAENDKVPPVNFLTSLNRTEWFNLRKKIIESSKENEITLQTIEKAIFVLCLDDSEPQDYTELFQNNMLNCDNRWFDKSCSIIICKNGYLGGNIEHSWGDAPIVSHLEEYFLDEEKKLKSTDDLDDDYQSNVKALKWNLSDDLVDKTYNAKEVIEKKMEDADLTFRELTLYGKDFVKKQNISPDAFFQMALQLTYYKIHQEFTPTYETAGTRFFYQGRTETIRSVTDKSVEFVLTMMDEKKSREEKIQALRQAQKLHAENKKFASEGRGFDRHMMGLRILAGVQSLDLDIFSDPSYQMPWKLATSQTPSPTFKGGGFMPLTIDGYGVSYNVHPDCFDIHVTSKKSCRETDSTSFIDKLEESLREMKELFES